MLRLDNLAKSFGDVHAVDGLSLTINRGEVFGLLGPNGAGKSTTIALCVGLLTPDRGSVTINGSGAPTSPAARARLGVAPQALALYDDLSALENLAFFGRLYHLTGRPLRERAEHVLDRVGLLPRARDRVSTFSGGMKRRLNLACALIHDPPLLLLDEPTAGVDPQSRAAILDHVRDAAHAGRAVVYTTHYMDEAAKVCDRVGIIDHGRLLALGSVRDLIARHGGDSTVTIQRAGDSQTIRTPDPLREAANALAQGPVDGVHIAQPDLESVFLALTGRSLRD